MIHNTVWQGMGVSVTHNTVWQGMVGVSDTQYCMARYGGCQGHTITVGRQSSKQDETKGVGETKIYGQLKLQGNNFSQFTNIEYD